ncbi:MAG: CBS domain-containing protein [Desulfobacterales bacterium]|jgi:CBS domain-containing protein
MVFIERRSVLSGMLVQEAMRKRVIRVSRETTLSDCTNRMVKNKVAAVLVTAEDDRPVGVVSKTDLIGAFYADLPVETAAADIMAAPPLFCFPDDSLESAIDQMHARGVHRLYVSGAEADRVIGTLAYPDVVGLIYRYCRACGKSVSKVRRGTEDEANGSRLRVGDVMTTSVRACKTDDTLAEVIEELTTHRCGAVFIRNPAGHAAGVISKTDLVIAYKHGEKIGIPAKVVMRRPVLSCDANDFLSLALQQMLLKDVQRLFVYKDDPARIVGVLSLSDSARFRSGSCRACTSGRLIVGV